MKDLDVNFKNALKDRTVIPIFFVKYSFLNQNFCLFSGRGEVQFDGDTWYGSTNAEGAEMVEIKPPRFSEEGKERFEVTLFAGSMFVTGLSHLTVGIKTAKLFLYLGVVNPDTLQLISDPNLIFPGQVKEIQSDAKSGNVKITAGLEEAFSTSSLYALTPTNRVLQINPALPGALTLYDYISVIQNAPLFFA